MNGVGVFFNQMIDRTRFETLAQNKKIDWITPLMAPDQSAVQVNRQEWKAWRTHVPALYLPWIACDHYSDPNEAVEIAKWIVANYDSNGIVYNCEKAYESDGKWRGRVLVEGIMADPVLSRLHKVLSYPSTPAERYDMDYRVFERAGFWFAPQAYWNDKTIVGDATPQTLYKSTYLPGQVHVGRDYRIWVYDVPQKHWCRVVSWDGGDHCIIQDRASARLYRLPVIVKSEGTYKYMVNKPSREFLDYKTGKIKKGKILGFQVREKIVPTVGAYDTCPTTPAEIVVELRKIDILKGASLYLGDTSTSAHVEAVGDGING